MAKGTLSMPWVLALLSLLLLAACSPLLADEVTTAAPAAGGSAPSTPTEATSSAAAAAEDKREAPAAADEKKAEPLTEEKKEGTATATEKKEEKPPAEENKVERTAADDQTQAPAAADKEKEGAKEKTEDSAAAGDIKETAPASEDEQRETPAEETTKAITTAGDSKDTVPATGAKKETPAEEEKADTAAAGATTEAAPEASGDKKEEGKSTAAADDKESLPAEATEHSGAVSGDEQEAPAAEKQKQEQSAAPAVNKEATSSSTAAPATAETTSGSTSSGSTSSKSSSSSSTAAPAPPAADKAPVQVVALAPGAAPVDDINPEGACKDFIKSQCEDVELGDGQVAECLSQVQEAAESDDKSDEAKPLSDDCNEEVMQFKINRNSNINKNVRLARACSEDAEKYCKDMEWYDGYRNGSIIACLREVKQKLTLICRREVFKVQLDASYDYRADKMLFEACQKDAETLCKDVKNGGGRVQACLRANRNKLNNWDCEYQLFRKELEDSDDLRLSVKMFHACLADKKQFCADVPAGKAMAKQCLEEHREELSSKCRDEIDTMIERRVRDFRLDSRLKKACQRDIGNICAWGGDMESMDTYDDTMMNCLQDFRDEIRSEACKAQVHKYVELAAQDIRFDVPLADACYDDRMSLCSSVPPGSARVIRCLQTQRDKLSTVCRATLFNEEARFSENVDFQYPMKQACLKEMDRFCKNVPHGNARVIRCLQEKKSDKEFGKACRAEVERYEQESAKDYRLNYRLYTACKSDIGQTCKNACELKEGEICGGKVLACLADNKELLKQESCRKEVAYLEKMEVNDFRIDMALAEACREDVGKYCGQVEPGDGRVHKCLRDNMSKLSDKCKREEMRIEVKEADNVKLNVGLLRACSNERSLFCRGVQPGSARVFRCLAENMASADFGRSCKDQIMKKLRRRESNWRLDPPLRAACREDVGRLCVSEDEETKRGSDNAIVKLCMIKHYSELSEGCQRELGRSIHMSFFVWQPKGTVTAPCDTDIQELCLSKNQGMEVTPGAVAVCLSEIVDKMAEASDQSTRRRRLLAADKEKEKEKEEEEEGADKEEEDDKEEQAKAEVKQQGRKEQPGKADAKGKASVVAKKPEAKVVPKLSNQCFELASIAEPAKVERTFDVQSAAYSLLTSSMEKLGQSTGLPTVTRNRQGGVTAISLTGWMALLGIAALVVVLMAASTLGVRQYLGPKGGYALVATQQ